MSKVYTGASMSLDGYIAGPGESGFEHLFEWYGNGEVVMPTKMPDLTFKLSPVSAKYLQAHLAQTGSLIVGRKLFDVTKGWGGEHPMGRTVVVLTHNPPQGWADNPNFVFVTEGIEAAVDTAKQIAGDRIVGVNGGVIARQCLNAGLLDEIWVDLIPVLLGGGTPFFDQLSDAPVSLDGPLSVVEGDRVTHLRYRVRK
ncbi:deaminase [Rhizocola hellebori]|uniref:Deaminase n=1 Tax=Rhizocola hellebori TaxID=1392758 RepID=A0A8J3VCN2_9ACTN|nr:dihydrofolate reductase family protein [Rhizocola hellebori]GIH01960.1 deaminase [Rhizocola hellebori]